MFNDREDIPICFMRVLWIKDGFRLFLITFSGTLPKISPILLKYVKIVKSTIDFIFKDKKVLLTNLI